VTRSTERPAPGARQRRDLRLHQLAHDQRDRVAQQVTVLATHRFRYDIGRGHHPVVGQFERAAWHAGH
jgi:hypothetical protein